MPIWPVPLVTPVHYFGNDPQAEWAWRVQKVSLQQPNYLPDASFLVARTVMQRHETCV